MTNPSNPDVPTVELDFPWCLNFLERQGRARFGKNFHLAEKDHDVIYKLMVYFLRLEPQAEQAGIDLSKGLFITGPIGCGKTSLMTLMRLIPTPAFQFVMKPCREVTIDFIQDGYEVIYRYSKMSYTNAGPKTYCFDDLGTERAIKYYGNECNVMGEVLLSRYDLFIAAGMTTHIITNLSATEVEQYYGNRLRSRMRAWFNLISFDKATPDKRK